MTGDRPETPTSNKRRPSELEESEFASEQERLTAWLSGMGFNLEVEFPSELPDDFPFDYSQESPVQLEEILINEFETTDQLKEDDNLKLVDRAFRYIGEALVVAYEGCEWRPGVNAFNGLPVIFIPDGTDVPVCPHNVIRVLVAI
jgi:hypothetical protein